MGCGLADRFRLSIILCRSCPNAQRLWFADRFRLSIIWTDIYPLRRLLWFADRFRLSIMTGCGLSRRTALWFADRFRLSIIAADECAAGGGVVVCGQVPIVYNLSARFSLKIKQIQFPGALKKARPAPGRSLFSVVFSRGKLSSVRTAGLSEITLDTSPTGGKFARMRPSWTSIFSSLGQCRA